jgi:hypothetical protein
MALSPIFIEPFLFPCCSFLRLYEARTARAAGANLRLLGLRVLQLEDGPWIAGKWTPCSSAKSGDDFYMTIMAADVITYRRFSDFLDADRNEMRLSSALIRYLNYWYSN